MQPVRKQSVPSSGYEKVTGGTQKLNSQALTVQSHLEQHHLQLTTKHLSGYTSSTTRNQVAPTHPGHHKVGDSYFSKPNQPIKSSTLTNAGVPSSSIIQKLGSTVQQPQTLTAKLARDTTKREPVAGKE